MNETVIKIYRAAFKICGCAIAGENIPGDCVAMFEKYPEQIFRATARYGIAPVAGYGLSNSGIMGGEIHNEIIERFRIAGKKAALCDKIMRNELKLISKLFNGSEIPFIPLKGAVLSDFYPEPGLRTRCDIDILIREGDLNRAADLLKSKAGYKAIGRTAHDLEFISENRVPVELHYRTIEPWYARESSAVLSEIWDYAAPCGDSYQYILKPEMFRFFHYAHMAKHFEKGGCGVRPFLDLFVLNRRFTNNRERDIILKDGGLSDFANACDGLSEFWFGGGSPNGLIVRTEEFILNGGMFGSVKNMAAAGETQSGGKRQYIFQRLFLPFGRLRIEYPVLQNHPWLTPFIFCRRFAKMVAKGHFRRSLSELKNTRYDYGKTDELFSLLGLKQKKNK